jgi:hypothetical protein
MVDVTGLSRLAVAGVITSRLVSKRERKVLAPAAARAQFGVLFDEVSQALFQADPVGIGFGANTDEYEPEVGTILPRLADCKSASDVTGVVHEEFVCWFDAGTAGPASRYERVAATIWKLWCEHRRAHS